MRTSDDVVGLEMCCVYKSRPSLAQGQCVKFSRNDPIQ